MGAVQDTIEQYLHDAGLTPDDLPAVHAAIHHHFGTDPAGTDPAGSDPALHGPHTYLDPDDRFVAALAVSYDPVRDEVTTMKGAVAAALDLTRDSGCASTQWRVYDRATGQTRIVEQGDLDTVEVR